MQKLKRFLARENPFIRSDLLFFIIVTFAGVVSAHAGPLNAADWAKTSSKIPASLTTKEHQIAEEHFYECKITRLGVAIDRLKDCEFIELSDDLARYYVGHSYRTLSGRKAYLVRGVFANYTGKFNLYFNDGSLLVQHLSLGGEAKVQYCPLIVQLATAPKKLFIQTGGAQ